MRRRHGALPAWGLVFALALSACQGGEPAETPVPGGELTVTVRDLGSLDPAVTTGRGALLVASQVFDSLTTVDPGSGAVKPAAASGWTVSADGLSWVFQLADATYHDGTPVTANDFKAAFDRIARKATNSSVAFLLEAVNGFAAAKIAGTIPGLPGIKPAGPKTLRIVLDRPFAELPAFLAHPSLAPLAPAMAKNLKALQTLPIGNGAFEMRAARASDSVTLDRFDAHAGGTALLDSMQVRLVSDGDQGWRDFLDGRSDVAEVPTDAIPGAAARIGRGGFGPFWAASYYGPNLKNAKYAKPEVRKAISLAIDRDHIAREVYGGTKEAATGIIPPGIPGYDGDACAECERDVDRARTLITAAFGGKPPPMTIDHLNASPSKEVAAAVVADLKEIGLTVSLRAHNSTEYLKLLLAGGHEIAELAWSAETPSPDGFLAQQLRTGSPNNPTGFADKSFDTLIDQARAATNTEARLAAYQKAQARAFEVMPLIPIVFFRNHVGVGAKVRDLRVDGAGLFDAARVWISQR